MDRLQSRLIEMRFFAGMTAEESSTALGLPVQVVRRKLRLAQAWLRREMTEALGTGAQASSGVLAEATEEI